LTEIIWSEIIPEVDRYVSASSAAKAALDTLVQSGCDRSRILRALYKYCGGSPDMVRAAKRDFRRKRDFILKLAKRLERRVVPEIKNAEQILEDAGFAVSSSAVEEIESYAEFLRDLANAVLKPPSSGRITARDQHLRFLAELVEIITGREHYAELTGLTAAVRFGYAGDPGTATAANIGRLVRRIRSEGPLDFEYLQEPDELKKLSTNADKTRPSGPTQK
jgi:hypothetical protein